MNEKYTYFICRKCGTVFKHYRYDDTCYAMATADFEPKKYLKRDYCRCLDFEEIGYNSVAKEYKSFRNFFIKVKKEQEELMRILYA